MSEYIAYETLTSIRMLDGEKVGLKLHPDQSGQVPQGQFHVQGRGIWYRIDKEGGLQLSDRAQLADEGWQQPEPSGSLPFNNSLITFGEGSPGLRSLEVSGRSVGLSCANVVIGALRAECQNREPRSRTVRLKESIIGAMAVHLDGGTFRSSNLIVKDKKQSVIVLHRGGLDAPVNLIECVDPGVLIDPTDEECQGVKCSYGTYVQRLGRWLVPPSEVKNTD